jgi:hypothetical protein
VVTNKKSFKDVSVQESADEQIHLPKGMSKAQALANIDFRIKMRKELLKESKKRAAMWWNKSHPKDANPWNREKKRKLSRY